MKFLGLPPVWQWWNKDWEKAPPLLRYCVHTVKCFHPSQVMLEGGPYDGSNLRPDHQADLIRAIFLNNPGGIWLDVDYLCWAPIYDLVDVSEKMNVWRRDDGLLDNDFLAAPFWGNKESQMFWSKIANLSSSTNWDSSMLPTRGSLGADILNEMERADPGCFRVVDHTKLCPYRRMTVNMDAYTDYPFKPEPGTRGMMLLNSVLTQYMDIKDVSIRELKSRENVLGAILRYVDSVLPVPWEE